MVPDGPHPAPRALRGRLTVSPGGNQPSTAKATPVDASPALSRAHRLAAWVGDWVNRPQPIVRLETLRILVPIAILGFMSSRIVHADHWLSDEGFTVPDLGGSDWRQPLYIPPVPGWAAWLVGVALVASGLFLAVGFRTRLAAGTFAALLFYVALADRLAAFTVSKIGPVLIFALVVSPCGVRYSIDAWLSRPRQGAPLPDLVAGGNVRFFQALLPVFYFSSGICKARGDWLDHPAVLWTHLHSSYQTPVSYFLASSLPSWCWTVLQGLTLAFEVFAPLWFAIASTRPFALGYGIVMHLMIGLMFGPVVWFSLLMISVLIACYAPERWLRSIIVAPLNLGSS